MLIINLENKNLVEKKCWKYKDKSMIKKEKNMMKKEIRIKVVIFNSEIISINNKNNNNLVLLINQEKHNNNNKTNKDKNNSTNKDFNRKFRIYTNNNNLNNKIINIKVNFINNLIKDKELIIVIINNFMKVTWEKLVKLQLKYTLLLVEKLVFNFGDVFNK